MESLVETVPWLAPAIYWILAVAVLWLLMCVPAAVLRRVSMKLHAWTLRLAHTGRNYADDRYNNRVKSIAAQRESVISSMGDRPIDSTAHEQWLEDIDTIKAPLIEATKEFAAARNRNDEALRGLLRTGELATKTTSEQLRVPELPNMAEAGHHERKRSAGWLDLTLGILGLVPLVIGNALITALVLRDAFPEIQGVFASVPPAYALAVIITIAEVAVGVIHGHVSSEGEEGGRQLTIGLVIVTILAVVPIAMELLFYSQFRENVDSNFKLPLFDIEVPPGSAFGLLGLFLGSTTFFLGRLVYVAARTLVVQTSLRRTRLGYEKVRDVIAHLYQELKAGSDKIHAVKQFEQILDNRRLVLAAAEYEKQTDSFLMRSPDWVKPVRRPLNSSEVASIESAAIISSLVALVGVASMVYLGAVMIRSSLRSFGPLAASAVAIIPTLAMFYGGFVWGKSADRRVVQSTRSGLGLLLVGLTLGALAGYLVSYLSGWSMRAFNTIALLTAGALIGVAGFALAGSASFVVLNSKFLFVRLAYLLLMFMVGSCYLLWLVAGLVDGVLALIALPAELLTAAMTRRSAIG